MLTVEERFMIKDLHRKGVSISDIARLTGRDRKTVRAAVARPLVPDAPRPRPPRATKLDAHRAYLEGRMADGVYNARKLCRELRARGFDGSETTVRDFVRPFRRSRPAVATVRFETAPGEQAQVDWAHFGTIDHHGRRRPLYAFLMALGWSRMLYVEFVTSMDSAIFLRCHRRAFEYFGGLPRSVLYDNLKTAVLERDPDGAVRWQPRFLDFAAHYGFTPRACRPYRAQTKGKVERSVAYLRGDFWAGLAVDGLDDLNRQARAWLDGVANVRVHGTTGEPPAARLGREGLVPLAGTAPYDTSVVSYRWSSADGCISYDGNAYSVPLAVARQHLLVRETEDGHLAVLSPVGDELARHRLARGVNQRVVDPAHHRPAARAPHARPAAPPPAPRPACWLPDAPAVEARPLAEYDRLAGVRP